MPDTDVVRQREAFEVSAAFSVVWNYTFCDVDPLLCPPCRPAVHSPLEQSQLSFAMKKKLSASAGNLWETGRAVEGGNGENSSLTHAHMQLSKTIKEKVSWSITWLL